MQTDERAKKAWNSISDRHNDWDALSQGERDTYAALTAALSDEQTQAGVKAAIPTANCCVCGRIIDTREKSEGGDDFGDESEPGKWTCSVQCFDAHVGFVPDVPAVEPEPVCTVALVGAAGFRWLSPHPIGALDHLPVGTPLYAAPVRSAIVPAQDEAELRAIEEAIMDSIDEYRESLARTKYGPLEWPTIDGIKAAIRSALSPRTVSTSEEQGEGSAIISKGAEQAAEADLGTFSQKLGAFDAANVSNGGDHGTE